MSTCGGVGCDSAVGTQCTGRSRCKIFVLCAGSQRAEGWQWGRRRTENTALSASLRNTIKHVTKYKYTLLHVTRLMCMGMSLPWFYTEHISACSSDGIMPLWWVMVFPPFSTGIRGCSQDLSCRGHFTPATTGPDDKRLKTPREVQPMLGRRGVVKGERLVAGPQPMVPGQQQPKGSLHSFRSTTCRRRPEGFSGKWSGQLLGGKFLKV